MTANNLNALKIKIIQILNDLEKYKCPQDWTNVINNLQTNCIEVTLKQDDPNYGELSKIFNEQMPKHTLQSIIRIQNKSLWKLYQNTFY